MIVWLKNARAVPCKRRSKSSDDENHVTPNLTNLSRREFLAAGMSAGVAALVANGAVSAVAREPAVSHGVARPSGDRFCRLYAPHFGMFRHHAGDDPIDQIRFMAEEGFRALEDNGLTGKPRRLQERIGAELDRRGMRMGLFVGCADFGNSTFASGREDFRRRILREVR